MSACMTCSMITIVIPRSRTSRIVWSMAPISAGFSPARTSSRSSRSGSAARARASSSRFFWATLSVAASCSARLAASETGTDHHVFADGELVERPDDLVGSCHAQARHVVRAQATEIVAAEDDAAAVWAIDGVEDVEERRLAGPVRADESQDLAFFHAECDMGQGLETAKPLADVLDAQHHRYSRVPRRRGILARRAPISPLGMNRMMSSSTKPAIVSCSDLNGSLVSRKLRSRSYPAAPITGPRTVPKPPSMTMTIISIDVERRKASGGSML